MVTPAAGHPPGRSTVRERGAPRPPGAPILNRMRVLLPPSEGKATPVGGRPLRLDKLVHPEFELQRRKVVAAVNPGLLEAPAARASAIYTGVLFGQLRLAELPATARRRVLIFSGLWGVLRPDDRIPAYKLPIGTPVPGLGRGLAGFWRPALTEFLPDRGLVLDLRSGPYAAAWRPRKARTVAVRGFAEAANGQRSVVSHMVKRIRGDVARAALLADPQPRTPADIAAAAETAGMCVELAGADRVWTLDVIER